MKIFRSLVVLSLILFALVSTVYAHSGGTDSNGGHTNHSTGEYHYHHGYPAHDHYDMDGDGDLDCPYEFDDKTDSDSGINSSGNSSSPYSSSNNNGNSNGIASNNFTNDIETKNAVPQSKGTSVIPKILTCIFAAAASIPVSFFCVSIPTPISLIVEWLSERSGGSDAAYRFWTGLFVIAVQVFIAYKIITL